MMSFSRFFIALTLVATIIAKPSVVTSNPGTFKIEDSLHQTILSGLHELYNFNFDQANAIFTSVEGHEQQHPMVSFGKASAEWWRISALVLENDAEESAPFLKAAEKCIALSEQKIKDGDPTGEAHLVLGGILGLLGRWEATNGQWMSAYFKGKKAIRYLEKAMQINPEMYDAYMGIGMFEYYVATLPSVVRMLAFIGRGGDPAVGLRKLHEAAEMGTYARTPSTLFLCQIYSQLEKKPELALPLLEQLRQQYPLSPFIHMVHIISLYNANRLADLQREADDMLEKFRNATYPEAYLPQAYFAVGAAYFKKLEWDTALSAFEKGTDTGDKKDPWRVWSALYAGYCLDMLDRRDQARERYQHVLGQSRRWGSHDLAKPRLKTPFKGTDDEMKMLNL